MPPKLQSLLNRLRSFLARPDVQRWLPNRKVVAGAVAAVLVRGGQVLGVVDFLPDGWAEASAYALVAYLVKEPGVTKRAAARALAHHGYDRGYGRGYEAGTRDALASPAPFSDRPLDFHPDVEAVEDPVVGEGREDPDGPGLV